MSRVRGPLVSTVSIARTTAAAASGWPRWSSIIAPDQIWPIGLAMPRPAMSGAEPWTGSNIEGNVALGVDVGRGRDADRAGHRRAQVGEDVAEQIRADHHVEPVGVLHEVRGQDVDVVLVGLARPGSRAPTAFTRSSQYGMVIAMPLDFVAEVRCRFGRVLASS